MAQFSENDINEAKRRVWEMQNKASRLVTGNADTNNEPEKKQPDSKKDTDESASSDNNKEDKSFFIILALIMLLSRDGADNTLILALLYLLL